MDYEVQYNETTGTWTARCRQRRLTSEVYRVCIPFKVSTCTPCTAWRPEDNLRDLWVRICPNMLPQRSILSSTRKRCGTTIFKSNLQMASPEEKPNVLVASSGFARKKATIAGYSGPTGLPRLQALEMDYKATANIFNAYPIYD